MLPRDGDRPQAPRSSARRCFSALSVLLALGGWLGCERERSAAEAVRPPEAELVVFAAASLRDAFTELASSFEAAHPGSRVVLSFAGTQELRTQIEHGARADVFASADQKHMDALAKASLISEPVLFARNEPVVVVARESGERIRVFADVPKVESIVVGAPEVPIGQYTLQILERAGASFGREFRAQVESRVVSRELNVRQVLAKVTLGEADLAFVYRSDAVAAAERASIVAIPAEVNVIADYPIAALKDAPHPALARDWIAGVLSAEGQRVLEAAGFLPRGAT